MEAVPRLPMSSFDLKISPENAQFGPSLKQYIATFYNEDPESYNTEINNLESLRAAAIRPTTDVAGCQLLKKYYCQLHFLKSRFPMHEGQAAAVYFAWKDTYSNIACTVADIRFELMCILYNIGALHMLLGAVDSRTSADGLKMACTHFQCAAWAFQTVKETYHQMVLYLSSIEVVHFMQQVCLAQAQECILEKSMMDNRKATITAKVAVQVVDHYKRALSLLSFGDDETSFSNFVGGKTAKEWSKYLTFKVSYHKCISLLFQGQQAEEQQKMGERVAFYQAASEQLEEARKLSSGLKQYKDLPEAIAFTSDVVEGKKKAAKNENEFIYHEEVPERHALQEVKGASLVKGIAFNVNDVEVSGPDIFSRLVPMEAHEASSLYSEKKAQRLRQLGELVESKDQALAEFMSSLQLDVFTQMRQATGLSQELVDRAAALSAKPTATQDLVAAMGKLSNSYHEVESMLNEIQELLKEEEQSENEYQELMGKRPPSIIATDLSREAAKYREAHNKANESNQNLHKAMSSHIVNLKVLAHPLSELQKNIPAVELPNHNVDESCVKEIENLISKVEEMRNQRAMLWTQFREAVHKDDITSVLVTRQPDQSLDQVFQEELQKHNELASLIEQNVAAQENILKAFVDAYARSMSTRRYLQDIISKRNATVTALITSYDTYEDLVAKANKGIDFYNKLETNVSKLLQRIKSACKVQQEEREQILLKNSAKEIAPSTISSSAPKLKDYLDTRKKGRSYPDTSPQYYPHNMADTQQTWPPAVRPAPLGSEVNNDPVMAKPPEQMLDQSFVDRLTGLRTGGGQYTSYTPPVAGYNYPQPSPSSTSLPATSESNKEQQQQQQAFTMTTDTYQPISSITQHQQFAQYPGYQMGFTNSSTASSQEGAYNQSIDYSQVNQQTYQYNYEAQPVSQPQNYPTNYNYGYQVGQPIVSDTYYPSGYGPPATQAATTTSGYTYPPHAFGSNEYATSVHPNTTTVNQSTTYSSPIANIKSSASGNSNSMMSNGQGYPNYDQYYYGNYASYGYVQPATGKEASADSNNPSYSYVQPTATTKETSVNSNYSSYGYVQPRATKEANVASNYPSYGYVQPTATAEANVNSNYANYGYVQPVASTAAPASTKESNIDLLTGLDFTVNQAPLIPQQNPVTKESKPVPKPEITKVITKREEEVQVPQTNLEKVINRKPLNNTEVKKLFLMEVDKYEKFVDVLTNKTLNGPTNLELKWKEIFDKQELEKKAISVARCYPMKNRYPDILPYDHSRVELKGAKDDYINASFVKDVSYYAAPFIVTQAPSPTTISDFWTMIKEQHVELIVSLLSDSETGSDAIYWPIEKGRDLTYPGLVVSLKSLTNKPHWIERLISISVPEKRDSRVLMHLQFTSWPGSLFPTSPDQFVTFVTEVTSLFLQQRSTHHPVVVHCLSGIGRSGLLCVLMSAILEVTSNPTSIPDLVQLTVKLAACRKNILRDREHLKFAYEAFLVYMKQVIAQGQAKRILNEVKTEEKPLPQPVEIKQDNDDPLSSLDPFWASKRGGN